MSLRKSELISSGEVSCISRGVLCDRVQAKWDEFKKLAAKKKPELITAFLLNLKDCDRFDGILHRNTFKVSHEIGLVALGFFGPHEVEKTSYDVIVEIELMKKREAIRLGSFNWNRIPAQKDGIFWVYFENPFVILPNNFYSIAFSLEGSNPKTRILDPKLIQQEISICVGDTNVQFDFLRGSLQMPQLKFKLL